MTLEDALRKPAEAEDLDIIEKVKTKYDITKEPEVFISKTDEMFKDIMKKLEEQNESTDISYSIKPLFDKDSKIDGVFLSFSKKF